MPVVVLGEEDTKKAREAACSDLLFLFAEHKVDDNVQLAFFHGGVSSAADLLGLEESRGGMRRILKLQLGLDGDVSLKEGTQVSRVIHAWEGAAEFIKVENQSKAIAKDSGLSPVRHNRAQRHEDGRTDRAQRGDVT